MYGQNVTLTATVVEVQRSDEEKYKLRCDVGGELLLCSYYRPLVNHWDLTGCEITFTAAVEKPKPSGNPRTFDYGLYLKTKKIFLYSSNESLPGYIAFSLSYIQSQTVYSEP